MSTQFFPEQPGQALDAPRYYPMTSTSDLATVTAAGFAQPQFNGGSIQNGDFIFARLSDGNFLLNASVVNGVVTLSQVGGGSSGGGSDILIYRSIDANEFVSAGGSVTVLDGGNPSFDPAKDYVLTDLSFLTNSVNFTPNVPTDITITVRTDASNAVATSIAGSFLETQLSANAGATRIGTIAMLSDESQFTQSRDPSDVWQFAMNSIPANFTQGTLNTLMTFAELPA